jgi:MFS family permease
MTAPVLAAPVQLTAIRRARNATFIAFTGSGFVFANWASRIPQVRTRLGLDASSLGLMLLSLALGSVLALPVTGHIVSRFGSRGVVRLTAVMLNSALAVIAIGYQFGETPVVIGLFCFGFANGAWDVAMNVQGALVERGVGHSIMSRFHAGFSLGTVGGALVGAAMVALGVPVTAHLLGAALLVGVVVPAATRGMLSDADNGDHEGEGRATPETAPRSRVAMAWREPRTLLIGVFVLAFAFAEGTGNDWIAVDTISGYHEPAALGTLAFAAFLAAMTTGRWFGTSLLDRFGRTPVVRCLAVIATVGVLVFAFGPAAPFAYLGALLWGFGVSLGFPVGMSAGADDQRFAAARVSVISSIGYCAFLGGPPLIGFLGDTIGLRQSVTAIAVMLVVSALIAASLRPLPGTSPATNDSEALPPLV